MAALTSILQCKKLGDHKIKVIKTSMGESVTTREQDLSVLARVFSPNFRKALNGSKLEEVDYNELNEFLLYSMMNNTRTTQLAYAKFSKADVSEEHYREEVTNYLYSVVSDFTGDFSSSAKETLLFAASKLSTKRLEELACPLDVLCPKWSDLAKATTTLCLKTPGGKVDVLTTLDRFGYKRDYYDLINKCSFEEKYTNDRSFRNFATALVDSSAAAEQEDFAFKVLKDYMVYQASLQGYEWPFIRDFDGIFKYDNDYEGCFHLPKGYGCRDYVLQEAVVWTAMERALRSLQWGTLRTPRLPNHSNIVECGSLELAETINNAVDLISLMGSLDLGDKCHKFLARDIGNILYGKAVDDSFCCSSGPSANELKEWYYSGRVEGALTLAAFLLPDGTIDVCSLKV